MGIGLSEYLTQERMRLAQSLLKNTSFPISIIASRVGYVNFSHFAKVFKQEFGVSPSEYRKCAIHRKIDEPFQKAKSFLEQ